MISETVVSKEIAQLDHNDEVVEKHDVVRHKQDVMIL